MNTRPLLLALALSAASLAGCGFQPLYSQTTVAALGQIETVATGGRTGFLLQEQLDDQFARNRDAPPVFRLEAALSERRSPYGGRVNNVANRYELNVSVDYRLFEIATRREVRRGVLNVSATYDSADPPYAGVAAQQNAEERAAAQAAVQLRLELARFFGRLTPR